MKIRGGGITSQQFSKESLYVQLLFGNIANAIQWEKEFFFKTNSAESNGYPQGKKQASVLTSYDTQHVTPKGPQIQIQYTKGQTRRKYLCNIRVVFYPR